MQVHVVLRVWWNSSVGAYKLSGLWCRAVELSSGGGGLHAWLPPLLLSSSSTRPFYTTSPLCFSFTQLCPFSSLLHNPSPPSPQCYLRGIFDRPWSKLIKRSVLISKYTPLPTKKSLIFESLPPMISSLLLIPFLSTDHQVWIHCLSWIQCKLGHYAYAWMYFHSFAEDTEDPN